MQCLDQIEINPKKVHFIQSYSKINESFGYPKLKQNHFIGDMTDEYI